MRYLIIVSSFFIITCGGGGGSPTESIQPPIVQSFDIVLDEDTQKSFLFSGIDSNNAPLSFEITDNPKNGNVIVSGAGGIYSPNTNFNGGDIFSYRASSINGLSNIASVVVTVNPVDDVPSTFDVSATTDEDNAVTMTLEAEEYDGNQITFNISNEPSNGNAIISGNTATYTPNQDWYGTDTFTFEVEDVAGRKILNSATATITVNPVNDAPIANNMSVSTNENRTMQLDITLDGTDVDGDNLTYTLVSDVSDGTTSLSGGTVTYTPNQDWNGEDSFTFKANDGTIDSNEATVTISVNAVNDAPITEDVTASTNEDTSVDISLVGSDIDDDNLNYIVVSEQAGTIVINGNIATYTPNQDWNGTEEGANGFDYFTYKANDGILDSNTSTVSVAVAAVNDPPTAVDKNLNTDEDTPFQINLLFGTPDIDTDSSDLTFSIVSSTSNGTLSIATGNNPGSRYYSYVPNDNWNGTDTFTYKINDGELDGNVGIITITVNPTNDPPTVNNVFPETSIRSKAAWSNDSSITELKINLDGSDIDGDNLTYEIVESNNSASTTINGNILTYSPSNTFVGLDTLTYKANDGILDTAEAEIVVTVAGVIIHFPSSGDGVSNGSTIQYNYDYFGEYPKETDNCCMTVGVWRKDQFDTGQFSTIESIYFNSVFPTSNGNHNIPWNISFGGSETSGTEILIYHSISQDGTGSMSFLSETFLIE